MHLLQILILLRCQLQVKRGAERHVLIWILQMARWYGHQQAIVD